MIPRWSIVVTGRDMGPDDRLFSLKKNTGTVREFRIHDMVVYIALSLWFAFGLSRVFTG